MRWELVIDQLETRLHVGICEHEQGAAQRIWIDIRIWADYPAKPKSIDECVDYGLVHDLITNQWPKRPQVELMETLAMELAEFIFANSMAINEVEIALAKPDIFENAKAVGLKARLTRAEFGAL